MQNAFSICKLAVCGVVIGCGIFLLCTGELCKDMVENIVDTALYFNCMLINNTIHCYHVLSEFFINKIQHSTQYKSQTETGTQQ